MARIRGIGTAQHARRRAIRPWNPRTILGADLELWLRSDSLVGLSGLDVATWGDLSGKGHNFSRVPGSRPTYNVNDANWAGKPSLGFTASQTILSDDPASTWNFLHNGTGGGNLLVYRTSATGANILARTAASTAQIGFEVQSLTTTTQRTRIFNGAAEVWADALAALVDTNYYGLFAYEESRPVNEYTHELLADTSVGNSVAAPTASNATITYALGRSGANGFQGELLEVIAFSAYPSDQQFTQLKAYLLTRYGLS